MEDKKLKLFKGYHYPMQDYYENHRNGGITQLSLDTKPLCNLKCTWCYNQHLNSEGVGKNTLILEEKKELLSQAKEIGARSLVIPGTGEPTLDPDFYGLVGEAYEQGLTTVVYTNLTGNIDRDKIKRLHDLDVSIGAKLDTFNEVYFQKWLNPNGKESFKKFRKNLDSLLDIYSESTETEERSGQEHLIYRTIANMVLTHENKGELEQIAEFCSDHSLPLFVRPIKPVEWAKRNINYWKILGNPSGELTPSQELVDLANSYNTLFSPSCTPGGHCAIYSFGLTVKDDGDILICPDHHDSKGELGNVGDKSLKEIVQNLNEKRRIQPGFCVMLPKVKHK